MSENRLHHRAKFGNSSRPQIISVAKATGKHDQIGVYVGFFMLDYLRFATELIKGVFGVALAVGAGEIYDRYLHITIS